VNRQAGRWVGWCRSGPGAPWVPVAEHDDLRACHLLLLKAAPGARSTDRFLTAGGYPVEGRRGR
jgi:hypothetical protein